MVRQKGYQNLNVVALDAIYPRSSHTRSPSFRRLRGIEEPPVLPTSPLHQFGCPPASATMSSSSSTTASSSKSSLDREEHHSKVQEAVAAITQHKDISMPSLSQSPSPRKLPVVPNLEDASIPGATWQRVPSYSYSRGVDTPPYFPPYRPAATTIKSKSTTKKSTSSRHMMDPTESVRRGYGFRSESTRSYCGSSLSSYETKRGRAAVRLEFQTPSMRSLSSYQYNRYTYSPGREDGHSPRTQSYGDDIQEYRSYLMEEPDYYYDEEEEEEVTYRDDHLMPQLMDSGGSSRGVDTSSSSSSSVSNMVDIGDGTQMRLRGADETWRAVENDFYAPGVCTCCQTTVFCIQDAGRLPQILVPDFLSH